MSTTKPESLLIVPDDLMSKNLAKPETEQTGPYAGPAAADMGNRGELVPFARGMWNEGATTAKPIPSVTELRIVRAGGLYRHAEWAWKWAEDQKTQYRGAHDVVYHTNPHDPFATVGSPFVTKGYNCVIYSKAYNKILCFTYLGGVTNKFKMATKDATVTDPDVPYTVKNWPEANGFDTYPERRPEAQYGFCSFGWENPDGTLRMMYSYSKPDVTLIRGNSAYQTIDIWGSSDGGETWELVVEDIANKYLGKDRRIRSMSGDVSGDWIRVSMWVGDVSPAGQITMVSADRGSTWKVVGNALPDGEDVKLDLSGTTNISEYKSMQEYQNCAVIGCNSPDGMFIRVRYAKWPVEATPPFTYNTYNKCRFEQATRESDWVEIPGTETNNASFWPMRTTMSNPGGYDIKTQLACKGIAGCATDTHAIVLVQNRLITGDGDIIQGWDGRWSLAIPLNDIENPLAHVGESVESGWETTGSWMPFGRSTNPKANYPSGTPESEKRWSSGFQNMDKTGYMRILLANSMRWVGDRIFLMSGLGSSSSLSISENDVYSRLVATQVGGWSERPIRAVTDEIPYGEPGITNGTWLCDDKNLISNFYSPVWGRIATGTSGGESGPTSIAFWAPFDGGSGVSTLWDPWKLQMIANSAGAYNYLQKNYIHGADCTNSGDVGMFAFKMKIQATNTAFPPPSSEYASPVIGARLKLQGDGKYYEIGVHCTTNQMAVYDATAGTTLYHAQNLDLMKWNEFRIAFGRGQFGHKSSFQKYYVDIGHSRIGNSHHFTNSGTIEVSTTTGSIASSVIQFGLGVNRTSWPSVRAMTSTIQVKELMVAVGVTNMALSNFGFDNPGTLRGAVCAPGERHIAQGIFGSWGGGGGFLDDSYTIPIRYQYGVDQLQQYSPSTYWRSKGTAQTKIEFDAMDREKYARFHHEAVAIVGCNVPRVRVEYSDNMSFSTIQSSLTVDMTLYTANISNALQDRVVLTQADSNKFEDGELHGKYIEIPTSTSQFSCVIRDNYTNQGQMHVVVDYDRSSSTGLSGAGVDASKPITIYGTQGAALNTYASTIDLATRYMRVTFPEYDSAEGFHRMGSIVAGATQPISVPLDWSTSDGEAGNVQVTTGINGTKVAYVAGPARRTFKGKIIGDASRYRDQFRASIRDFAKYSGRPLVLITDDNDMTGSMLYCRYQGSTEMENAAWKYDSEESRWIKVGNMSVAFEEEV